MDFTTLSGHRAGPVGQGTWYLGEHQDTFQQELAALRAGIDHGMTLIDTAEMYGEGAAEVLVGEAIQGYDRDRLYLVSKVYPWNAGRNGIFTSCENSLRRMRTDYLDLYLLHWAGPVPFAETVACMEELQRRGWIRHWGVSNLDTGSMQQLARVPGGNHCLTDQVLYHLGSRGVEYDLLPYLRRQNMPLMAYCPLAQAGRLRRGLLANPTVQNLAFSHDVTPSQILLAFLLAQPGVLPIPRSSRAAHTLENAAAAQLKLTEAEWSQLSRTFPAPGRKVPLDMQ